MLSKFLIFSVGEIKAPASPNYHEGERDDTHEGIMKPSVHTTASVQDRAVDKSLSRGNPAPSGNVSATFRCSLGF